MAVISVIAPVLILACSTILVYRFIAKSLSVNDFIFNVSLTLITTLGILQASTLWYQLISNKPLDKKNSYILLTLLLTALIAINLFQKNVMWIKQSFRKFDISLVAIPTLIFIFAFVSNQKLGDSGWDSNAYHIPIIGMLMKWGSNNWPISLSEGTFTIFSPYGVHSIKALFVSIFSNYQFANIPTGILFIGGTLIGTTVVKTNSAKLILLISMSLTPTIYGQLTRNYVDVWAGLFLFSAIMILAKAYDLEISQTVRKKLTFFSIFALSLSVSSKTQSLICGVLILISVLAISTYEKRSLDLKFNAQLILIFIIFASVPYLRNLIFFQNPIFPISNSLFSKGTISVSELSQSVNSFRPVFWPNRSFLDPLISVISPIWVLAVMSASRLGLYFDENRVDLSAFTYDTTSGGPGILVSIFLLMAAISYLARLLIKRKDILMHKSNANKILMVFAFILFISIPGAWYPRYGMALYLITFVLSLRFLESTFSKKLLLTLLFLGGIPSVLGLAVFQSYDLYSNHRNPYFNPKYGLDSPPESFSKYCNKLVIIEPRPTFSSFVWEANCRQIVSLPAKTEYFPKNFFLISNKIIPQSQLGDRKICVMRSWFDPKAIYGTYLYAPVGFKKDFCNPPIIKQ
jgi:hypothetical protein